MYRYIFSFLLLIPVFCTAAELPTLKLGLMPFGTVNWEIETLQKQKFDEKQGFKLEVQYLASRNALDIALQGKVVDLVVNDWLWVNRQRAEGKKYSFVPYSTALGALITQIDGAFKTLQDLKGKKLGVAGSALDKSWLLLRAYSKATTGEDIANWVNPVFAAPPLLNELMKRGELTAVLNYWHFSAKLEAENMPRLLTVKQMLETLKIPADVPSVGWVFNEQWATANEATLKKFFAASLETKNYLKNNDSAWETLKPDMKVENDKIFILLRDQYRAGIPPHYGDAEIAAAQPLFKVLAEQGGEELIGKAQGVLEGTFWRGVSW